uniref:Ejaculatory bulb-specific protein 3 n=1 Tax=Cacopsylla melanoneura TaxID=428564 RepID=A0A8D9BM19_9HEMI
MKLTPITLCLCCTLLLATVQSASVTTKPSADTKSEDKPSVTSSSSSSSSSKSSATAAAPAKSAVAPTKSAAAPAKSASSVSDAELDKLLLDRRYLSRQLKCALGEGVCDPVGRRLKSFAPLVLRGNCPQCTPAETRQIQKVLSHVQRNYPKEWAKIIQQFTGN